MLRVGHGIAGLIAIVIIAILWTSTVISEIFASPEGVTVVKTTIPWAFLLLIPALIGTGGSGFRLAGDRRAGLILAKTRRMQLVAANGLLVLLPSALFLAARARNADFDATFYSVQGLELVAGLVNMTLIALNLRDGLRMTGRLRRRVSR